MTTTYLHYVYLQEPVTVWSWQSTLALIIAVTMIGIVSVYLGYKAFQLRIPLVLRLIAETIDKIQKDKYPAETGVLPGRNEFIVNTLLDRLDQVGIQWEKGEKYQVEETAAKAGAEKELPPMNLQEINAALDSISELTVEEKAIFADELKRLGRKEQDEFIASLKHEGGNA
jgi:xanthosine utilization system XapX-like protein